MADKTLNKTVGLNQSCKVTLDVDSPTQRSFKLVGGHAWTRADVAKLCKAQPKVVKVTYKAREDGNAKMANSYEVNGDTLAKEVTGEIARTNPAKGDKTKAEERAEGGLPEPSTNGHKS